MKHKIIREPKGYKTITEMFERSAKEYSNRVMSKIKRGGVWREYTFGEVLGYVRKMAEYLKEKGIKKGDFVALVSENRPEWGWGYLAIQWAGGTVIPLDARLTDVERRFLMDFAGIKGVICSRDYLMEMEEAKKELKFDFILSMEDLDKIFEKYKGIDRVELNEEDLAEILFTSGTTGSPKGVMLTHKNIVSDLEGLYQIIDVNENDVFFSILPLHHVYECTGGFLAPIYVGASVAYASSLRPNVMLEEMREIRPTVWLTVPLILEKIYQKILKTLNEQKGVKKVLINLMKTFAKERLSKRIKASLGLDRVRYVISGGAALPEWVSKGLEDLGFPILQGYGLSETSPILTLNPPHSPRNKSVGLPIPGVEIRLFEVNERGEGEIAAKGPMVMKGYYKNEKATKEVFYDGWFLTGDIGYFDEDGYLYITGRKKAVIVTKGGKNIYPEEIENKLTESPYIEEVLVFGAINPETGEEEVQALVYPNLDEVRSIAHKMGRVPDDDFIYELISKEIERLSKDLAPYKRIKRFALRYEEFPKTTTRKIKRHLFEGVFIKVGEKVKTDL
ncbi:MAG: AMP-binding protein [Candidatus Caldipriscus sp.]|nr:AMP-binding protein [Candidatus Caldipriscus sp.]